MMSDSLFTHDDLLSSKDAARESARELLVEADAVRGRLSARALESVDRLTELVGDRINQRVQEVISRAVELLEQRVQNCWGKIDSLAATEADLGSEVELARERLNLELETASRRLTAAALEAGEELNRALSAGLAAIGEATGQSLEALKTEYSSGAVAVSAAAGELGAWMDVGELDIAPRQIAPRLLEITPSVVDQVDVKIVNDGSTIGFEYRGEVGLTELPRFEIDDVSLRERATKTTERTGSSGLERLAGSLDGGAGE